MSSRFADKHNKTPVSFSIHINNELGEMTDPVQRWPKAGDFIVVSPNPIQCVASLQDAEVTRIAQKKERNKYVAFVTEVSTNVLRASGWVLITG